MTRRVYVLSISIPPMSTIATCFGMDVATKEVVTFGADHRPAMQLGQWSEQAQANGDPPIVAEVEDWQVLGVEEPDEGMEWIIKTIKESTE